VRIQQTILGTCIYVAVDLLLWPVRAKLDLRRELQWSIEAVGLLWHHTLSIFLEVRGSVEPLVRYQKILTPELASL
jgi:hypothetical protein